MGGLFALQRTIGLVLAMAIAGIGLPAFAQERAQLSATLQDGGYARMILTFRDRMDLPAYNLKVENGILSITFGQEVDVSMPDLASVLPNYLAAGRTDPDRKGIRLGFRTNLNVNSIEAGEKLFIDLLPPTWEGLPPSLPEEVVAELALRAKEAALRADQERKRRGVEEFKPVAQMRIGVNPTFMRVLFDWSVPTAAAFKLEEGRGDLDFEWPVPIDVVDLQANLPAEIKAVENRVTLDGSRVAFTLEDGVVPRFFQDSPTSAFVDFDIKGGQPLAVNVDTIIDAQRVAEKAQNLTAEGQGGVEASLPSEQQARLTPFVNMAGATVRVVFPFAQETPAAVFRRGDTVWMMFDTMAQIDQPADQAQLASIASQFAVTTAGDTQVVRLELSSDRLATLASEGKAWVLSLGDILLGATKPLQLERRLDGHGRFEMIADLDRPGRVHQFRDPDVGDFLTVVTAYPPSRSLARNLDYVDFSALRSVQGLVLKPLNENLDVTLEAASAVIRLSQGLTLSRAEASGKYAFSGSGADRDGMIDLKALQHDDPIVFYAHVNALMDRAAASEGRELDQARLELAQTYLANDLGYEAIGILDILNEKAQTGTLKLKAQMSLAAAQTVADRPKEALAILNSEPMSALADTYIWRTVANADNGDFKTARSDSIAAESYVDGYPNWVKARFFLAGTRAAIETGDAQLASRYLSILDVNVLDREQASFYRLLSGRLDELEGRVDEALHAYGQVLVDEIRPTHAEAVYRTVLLLNQTGRLDASKATQTLAAEAMLWRGEPLEADMQKLLADLYFHQGDYRLGFETVRQTVQYFPNGQATDAIIDAAQQTFADLYLNGRADELSPVDALGIYYDFRNFTPPGSRGDEMIRNLARRLVKVDLLPQAADLLRYQINNRLQGAAQAQIAADLAVIEIADRKPQEALRVLNQTRMPDLAPALERQRRVLEARAFIDAGRDELALDLVSRLSGRDVDLLRVDAHWRAKRYAQAGEIIEAIYGPEMEAGNLGPNARMGIIRAAVGYVLAGDQLGIDHVRTKFGDAMSRTAEWPMFQYVTGKIEPTSFEFVKVAKEIGGLDALNAFLSAYKDAYGSDGALTPTTAAQAGNDSTKPTPA